MTEPSVLLATDDGIATITLNRPARRNAFTSGMLAALDAAVDDVNADPGLFGVVVTGAGQGFCSGRDLAELGGIGEDERTRALPQPGGHESSMFARIELPTVAAVNGAAVGGGLGFVVQCDYIVCAAEARLKDGHLATGVVPSVAAWYVPRRIGPWRAMAFFARDEGLVAPDALALGLVDEVVAADELMSAARRALEPFRSVDRELLRHLKRLAVEGPLLPYDAQMERVGFLRGLERRGRDG